MTISVRSLEPFVQFGEGGSVLRFALAWEFCAVRVNGLSDGSNRDTVSEILAGLGFNDVSADLIRTWRETHAGETSSSAMIYVENATLAEQIREALSRVPYPIGQLLITEIVHHKAPPWSTVRHVSNNKVRVSWHRITHSVWLNFGNGEIARRASEKFNDGTYKILGERIRPDKTQASISRGRGRAGHSIGSWTVVLKNVPVEATSSQITDAIYAAYDRPRHVEVPEVHDSCMPGLTSTFVQSLLGGIGPVDVSVDPSFGTNRVKATARFDEEHDARRAVEALHDKPQDFLNGGKLTLTQVFSTKLKIEKAVYEIFKDNIHSEIVRMREQHVFGKVYEQTRLVKSFFTLKIEGESSDGVATASNCRGKNASRESCHGR